MKSVLFDNLDSLIWSAAEVQKRIPIEGTRLQTLMKRHFPKSEAVQMETGVSRRSYTGRMVVWLALTNKLMDMGISIGAASEMSKFSFYGGMDKEYQTIGVGENKEEIIRIGRMVAIAYPVADGEQYPEFGISDVGYANDSGSYIRLGLGEMLLTLAKNFENNSIPTFENEAIPVKRIY